MIKFSIWLFPSCHLLSPTPSEPRVKLPLLYIPIAMPFALSFLPILPPSPPISISRSADDDKIFRNSPIQTSCIFVVLRADTVCGEEGKYEEKKSSSQKLKSFSDGKKIWMFFAFVLHSFETWNSTPKIIYYFLSNFYVFVFHRKCEEDKKKQMEMRKKLN